MIMIAQLTAALARRILTTQKLSVEDAIAATDVVGHTRTQRLDARPAGVWQARAVAMVHIV